LFNVNSTFATKADAAANTYVNQLLANTNSFIDTKLDKTGGSITGSLTVQQNLTVDGDAVFNGNTTIINVTEFSAEDTILHLGANNAADTVDLGIVGMYVRGDGQNTHTGFIRDSGTKEIYIFNEAGTGQAGMPFTSFNPNASDTILANVHLYVLKANDVEGNGASLTSLNATNISSGTLSNARLPNSGVTANTYGSASLVPQITVDAKGIVTEINNINVAGVQTFSYTEANNTLTIGTADGNSFFANIGLASTSTTGVAQFRVRDSCCNT